MIKVSQFFNICPWSKILKKDSNILSVLQSIRNSSMEGDILMLFLDMLYQYQ